MKRFFFSLIALSAVAVGCTQSAMLETPDQFGTEITFSPYTGRTPVTKATSIADEAGLNAAGGFHILSFLNGTDVYMNGQVRQVDGVWTYGEGTGDDWDKTTMYWPDANSGSTLSFVAYSENATGSIIWSTKQGEENNVFTFSVKDVVTEQVDFLATAYQPNLSLKNNSSGLVELTFNHLLSRIGFKVQTSTDKKVTITALSLSGNIPTNGTLKLTEAENREVPVLVPGSPTSDKAYALALGDNGVDIVDANEEAKPISAEYMMLIPHGVDGHTINVSYKIDGSKDSNPKSISIPLEAGFVFKAGKAYDFILKISTSRMSFTVTETDWNNTHTNATPDNTLVPETQDNVEATVKVNTTDPSKENGASADVILIPNKANLGTLGVEYKLPSDSRWTPASTEITSYTANKPTASIVLEGLTPNTEYNYRAYSKNGNADPVYYSEKSFITKTAVTVTDPNEVNTNDVVIYPDRITVSASHGNYTVVEKGFCFVPGTSIPTIENKQQVNTTESQFSYTFTGLQPLTEYTVCAYIIVGDIISYSAPLTILTAPNVTVEDDTPKEDDGSAPDGPPAASWDEDEDENNDIII